MLWKSLLVMISNFSNTHTQFHTLILMILITVATTGSEQEPPLVVLRTRAEITDKLFQKQNTKNLILLLVAV